MQRLRLGVDMCAYLATVTHKSIAHDDKITNVCVLDIVKWDFSDFISSLE